MCVKLGFFEMKMIEIHCYNLLFFGGVLGIYFVMGFCRLMSVNFGVLNIGVARMRMRGYLENILTPQGVPEPKKFGNPWPN